jgi:hypothetical protein
VKLNNCLGVKVSNILTRILRLKLNPLLVAYARGFITVLEAFKFGAIISANGRFSVRLIFYKA